MIIEDISDESAGRAIEENLVSWWTSLRGTPGVEVLESESLTRVTSGLKHPICNHIFKSRFSGSVPDSIEEALRPAREGAFPLLWWVSPATVPTDMGDLLMEAGLTIADDVSCMAADLRSMNVKSDVPESVEILRVGDEHQLRHWISAFQEGFELPGFVGEFFFRSMLCAGLGPEAPMVHYLASIDGEPVATSTVAFGAGVAGFYNGATLERARRRGIGTAMNSMAIRDALARGYHVGVVQAMPMGVKICLPLGFREHYRMQAYLFEESARHDRGGKA